MNKYPNCKDDETEFSESSASESEKSELEQCKELIRKLGYDYEVE